MLKRESQLPLSEIIQDKLNFKLKAEDIAQFIKNNPNNIPYAISINGAWGSGKSTMLNFIEESLKDQECKVIRFNPWMIENKQELVINLFEEIYDSIDGKYTTTKEKIMTYLHKVSSPITRATTFLTSTAHGVDPRTATVVSSGAAEIVKQTGEFFFDKPLSKRKKELVDDLEDMIKDNNQKIVVMIDELDRLFPEEIIRIFQLIKSTLDLPGLFFVAAMDEKFICEALEGKGIKRPVEYLQKIFQRSYAISSHYQLRTLFEEFISKEIKSSNNESYKMLCNLIEIYVDLNRDKFIIDDFLLKKKNYYKYFYQTLCQYFENPRSFIKLKDFLVEEWPKCYEKIPNSYKTDMGYRATFVMLITYYLYPDYINKVFEKNLSKEKKLQVPEYIDIANELLNAEYSSFYKHGSSMHTRFFEQIRDIFVTYPDVLLSIERENERALEKIEQMRKEIESEG